LKRPKEIGLNYPTYQWLKGKKPYTPKDAQWFKTSYPIFTGSGFPESVREFHKIIAYAYSWMPTIPNVRKISYAEWSRIKGLLHANQDNEAEVRRLLQLLIPIINNSLVGTSKVLHFINPVVFPILDTRVLKTWNRLFKSRKALQLRKSLLNNHRDRLIDGYMNYIKLVHQWKDACRRKISIRKIEELLYFQK
jgi:hypothetical protein